MQKETILAKLIVSMNFSKSTIRWLRKFNGKDVWFAEDDGALFFSEYRGFWQKALVESCEPIVHDFFIKLGMPKERLPRIVVYESYRGSWIMTAAITMFASVGTAYTILKGLSELPKIADGLTELKKRLKKEFAAIAGRHAENTLKSSAKHEGLPPPPKNPIQTDLVIDARPALALRPTQMKSHAIHLSAAISREVFTLENLGSEALRDIRIGLFRSETQRDQWNLGDSYLGNVEILSPRQTITKDISEFRNSVGEPFDLSDSPDLHVDCWVQDSHGIYLFMFFLESRTEVTT